MFDVEITFVDDNHVNIKVKDVTRNRVHFSKMDFEYRKTGKEIQLWKTLRAFALHNGIIPPKVDEKGKLKKNSITWWCEKTKTETLLLF